jgi:hypothetical protein
MPAVLQELARGVRAFYRSVRNTLLPTKFLTFAYSFEGGLKRLRTGFDVKNIFSTLSHEKSARFLQLF